MSCLSETSRCSVPTAPRKYLVVTMFAALTDHSTGNSTPRCSKLTEPSRQLVMTTSRRSHSTSSYGWTPAVVWTRSMRSRAPLRGAGAVTFVASLTVSVMLVPRLFVVEVQQPRRPRHSSVVGVVSVRRSGGLAGRCERARGPCVGQAVAVAGAQGGDLRLEVGERLERAVDAGEPQVGDL